MCVFLLFKRVFFFFWGGGGGGGVLGFRVERLPDSQWRGKI